MIRSALLALGLSLVVACSAESAAPVPEPVVDRAVETSPVEPSGDGPAPAPAPGPAPEVPVATPGAPALGGQVGKWSWLDVPESTCGNGEPTGLGVNLGTGSELVIFVAGGGGCWDEVTCAAGAAKNVKDGYGKATFETDLASGDFAGAVAKGIFNRTLATNPYKDASFVVIPYCTGDVHGGDATKEFLLPKRTMHFKGRKNVEVFLQKIVPAFGGASRVTLTGVSAGGFGAALNYWRVQDAFGKTRVDLVDDSGPPFEAKDIPLLDTWRAAWNLDGALPPGCPTCTSNLAEIPGYYAKKYPSSRFSYLSYDQDKTISLFFLTPQPLFAKHLESMADTRIEPLANARFFIVPGTTHTMLDDDMGTKSGDTVLGEWLAKMHADSPAWVNVSP